MVRLSGPQALEFLLKIMPDRDSLPPHRTSFLQHITLAAHLGTGLPILHEQAMICCHHGPYSYTGDDLAEICIHGNPLLIERLITALTALGARLAEPGEFTFRAFVNGKLDLLQAEAVHDLINAGSSSALKLAQSALGGLTGRRINDWQDSLLDLLSRIELIHDYASDDLDASVQAEDVLSVAELKSAVQEIITILGRALQDSNRGSLVRHGISLAIVGPPNVGKSTLFNALLGYDRALVHHAPGTTRDYLSESVEFGGISFTLIDTAGQRPATDDVESAGVQLAADWSRSADMLISVRAADIPAGEADQWDCALTHAHMIRVVTRCDMLEQWPKQDEAVFHVSGSSGRGVADLRDHIIASCGLSEGSELAAFNRRQSALIDKALQHLILAELALDRGLPMDAAAQDIHLARESLLDVNRSSSRQQVIDNIFGSFCVGK